VNFVDLQSQFAAYEADIRAQEEEVLRSSGPMPSFSR
jgi:hypothetical protein